MTFSDEDPRDQLHVRLDSSSKRRIESYAESHGVSQSELTRAALEEYLPDEGGSGGPSDRKLREPYLWLRENADDYGEIPAKLAMTALAQELSMNQKLVQQTRLKPLQRRGWIDPDFGTIKVIPPEVRNHE